MGIWRHCSSCRADIGFQQIYWVCSVSTCERVARTGLFFCSVGCWEAHLPTMRHREAWAVEKRSPSEAAWRQEQQAQAAAPAPAPRPAAQASRPASAPAPRPSPSPSPAPVSVLRRPVVAAPRVQEDEDMSDESAATTEEVLVVVSKLKKYIRAKSGMNTSDAVVSVLSEHLRHVCDLAIQKATEDGRKTVLDRDFKAATGQPQQP
jgi:histone H3/H4